MMDEFSLWVVLEMHGKPADVFDPTELKTHCFKDQNLGKIQIYIGDSSIADPVWDTRQPVRRLNFPKSYAIQIVPSVLVSSQNILLQGFSGVSKTVYYEDRAQEKKMMALFASVKKLQNQFTTGEFAIMQKLSTGGRKFWINMKVGRDVPSFTEEGGRLKQFLEGEVEFFLERC